MPELRDPELAHRVAGGDQQALLSLYDRYSGRVFGLAIRMLSDPMGAEEVTQDVFLKLWTRARSYTEERGSLATWLLTITRNSCLDRLRLERRRLPTANDLDPERDFGALPDESTQGEESRWRDLYLAVQALPRDQRQAVELAYYQGLSHSQIAKHLGWPVGTVKTRLRLGMEHLRRAWLQDDQG